MKQGAKSLQKIRQVRDCIFETKKKKKQTREQVNNCAQGRPKNYANCKIETSKKNATLILLLHSQKNSNSTEKKAEHT